jgi:GTP-binding protein
VGLGHEFLRHIERTKVLVHLVDLNAEDPIKNYKTIQGELVAYGRGLPELPQIIALNKVDAGDREFAEFITEELRQLTNDKILTISAVSRTGLEQLLQEVWDVVDQLKEISRNQESETSVMDLESPPIAEE